jgi:hypothetical protein
MLECKHLTLTVIVTIGFLSPEVLLAQNLLPPPEDPAIESQVPATAEVGAEEYYEYGEYQDPGQKREWIPRWMIPDWHKDSDTIPGVRRWSRYDYEMRGEVPIGSRQKFWKGKVWPARARPTGVKPHLIHRFHAAHYWPEPFIHEDRQVVQGVLEQHISNGWRDASTFYDYHFDAETNELSHAGELQMRWLLESAPAHRKRFYVQTSAEAGANELRVTNLQQIASRLSPSGEVPPVELRNVTAYGRPALEVDFIRKAEIQSQPQPRIPYTGGSGPSYGSSN